MRMAVITASFTALLSGLPLPDCELKAQAPANRIVGAWRVLDITGDSAGKRITRRAQPGFYLFTERHYSITRVAGNTPRRDFPAGLRRTADTYREIWGPFIAQAGSYQMKGSYIATSPLVSKNPTSMRPGIFSTLRWRVVADTLWLEPIANNAGPIPGRTVVRLLRQH
jgi:hypothetical protein